MFICICFVCSFFFNPHCPSPQNPARCVYKLLFNISYSDTISYTSLSSFSVPFHLSSLLSLGVSIQFIWLEKDDVFKLFIQRLYYNTKDMREMYSTSSVNRICSVTGTGPPFKSTKTITHHEKEKLGLGIVRLKGETISHNRGEE